MAYWSWGLIRAYCTWDVGFAAYWALFEEDVSSVSWLEEFCVE